MKQYTITHIIASAEDPPDDLVAAPSSHSGALVAALGAKAILAFPKTKQLLPSFRVSLHLQVKPTLKVRFPMRIVRVSFPSDLDVSDDGDGRCSTEPRDFGFPIFIATTGLPRFV